MVALLLAVGYLLGSLPFAVLVSRVLRYPDPRTYGSGNPGATNVLRGAGRVAAVLTLVGDAGKGALAVWVGRIVGSGETLALACGAAAFFGHLFPVFLRFRGGKGVATFLGVLLAFEPWLGLACSGVWLVVALATRFSSLASLSAAAAAPLLVNVGYKFGGKLAMVQFNWPLNAGWPWWSVIQLDTLARQLALVLAMSLLLAWRHRSNIVKLRAGTESRIGTRS